MRKKVHFRHSMIWFFIAHIIILCSCREDGNPFPTSPNQTIISQHTKIILSDTLRKNLISRDSILYVFKKGEEIIDNLSINDIMVSDSGDGFIRKIIGIDSSNGIKSVITEQAAITDAIEKCKINYSSPVIKKMIRNISLTEGISLKGFNDKSVDNPRTLEQERLELTFTIDTLRIPSANANPVLKINGEVKVNFDIDLILEIDGSHLKKFKGGIRCSVDPQLNYNATGKLDILKYNILLTTIELNPIVIFVPSPIGIPLPVVFTPKIELYLGVNGNLYAGWKGKIGLSFTGGVGVKFEKNGEAGPYLDMPEVNPIFEPILPTAGVELKLNIEKRFLFLLYGMIGPYFNTSTYGEFKVELFSLQNLTAVPQASFCVGVQSGGGAVLEILGIKFLDFNKPDAFSWKYTIWKSPVIEKIIPNHASIGDNIKITGNSFGLGGSLRGKSFVSLNNQEIKEYNNWNNNEIIVRVPDGATSGKVVVHACPAIAVIQIPIPIPSNELDFFVISSDSCILTLDVSPTSVPKQLPGTPVNFTLTVRDQSGNTVSNAIVGIEDDCKNFSTQCTTGTDGTAPYQSITPASGTCEVRFTATKQGCTSSPEVSRQIIGSDCILTLDVSPTSVPKQLPGTPVNFTLTVRDQSGNTVSNAIVGIEDDCKNFSTQCTTGTDGTAPYQSITPASGTCEVRFTATKQGCTSSPEVSRQIIGSDCILTLDVSPISVPKQLPGTPVNFTLTVRDQSGNTVSNVIVGIEDDCKNFSTQCTTGTDGTAPYQSITPTSGTCEVRFTATKQGCTSSPEVSRQIIGSDCILTLDVSPISVPKQLPGTPVNFTLTVRDQSGNTVSNVIVGIEDDCKNFSTQCTTGTDGTAPYQSITPASGTCEVRFTATKQGCTSSPEVSRQIIGSDCILTLDVSPTSVPKQLPGTPVNFTLTVRDQSGNTVSNVIVGIEDDCKNFSTQCTTGTDGTAPYQSITPASGTCEVRFIATKQGCTSSPVVSRQIVSQSCTINNCELEISPWVDHVSIGTKITGTITFIGIGSCNVTYKWEILDNYGSSISQQTNTRFMTDGSLSVSSDSDGFNIPTNQIGIFSVKFSIISPSSTCGGSRRYTVQ